MELEPTRGEARLFVSALAGFCATSGFVEPEVPATLLLLLAVIPLGLTLYVVFARVTSRASGVPMRVLLGFRRPPRGQRIAVSLLTARFVTRSWWRPVLRATGWPVPLIVTVLVGTLAVALLEPFRT